jgi:hypothetical protein
LGVEPTMPTLPAVNARPTIGPIAASSGRDRHAAPGSVRLTALRIRVTGVDVRNDVHVKPTSGTSICKVDGVGQQSSMPTRLVSFAAVAK